MAEERARFSDNLWDPLRQFRIQRLCNQFQPRVDESLKTDSPLKRFRKHNRLLLFLARMIPTVTDKRRPRRPADVRKSCKLLPKTKKKENVQLKYRLSRFIE